MIPISLSWLVFICLLVFLAGIFFVWIGYELARRQQARRSIHNLLRCRVCSMEFSDESTDSLAKCPRCGSQNERQSPDFF
jgi:hypothetical protein